MRPKLVAAVQERELNEKAAPDDNAARSLDQFATRLHGAACRQQVVHQQHARVARDPIDMHVQFGRAVFEFVFQTIGAVGQLAGFPQRDQRFTQFQRQWSGNQKPACLGGGDGVDRDAAITIGQLLDRERKSVRDSPATA